MTKERFKKAEFVAWLSIAGNLSLALLKGCVGWFANSKALLADAMHSASLAASSFATLIGLRNAKLPPGEGNPYAQAKTESIASIIVSVLLMIIGVEIGISAIKSLYVGVDTPPKGYALIVIVISIVVKEAMFQYKYRLGQKMYAHSLTMNVWEHRSDLYTSLAALAGVGGALLGQLLGLSYFYYLDPLAGLIISLFILRMGFHLLKEAMRNTMNAGMHQEDATELLQIVQRIRGVITVDQMRATEHGHFVIVDVKISVNPRISVGEGHEIAKEVKCQLMNRFIHISDVFVHVHPYHPGYPYKNNLDLERSEYPTMLH